MNKEYTKYIKIEPSCLQNIYISFPSTKQDHEDEILDMRDIKFSINSIISNIIELEALDYDKIGGVTLDELNYLAIRINELKDEDICNENYETYLCVLSWLNNTWNETYTIKDLINLTYQDNLEYFNFMSGIMDEYDLGECVFDEHTDIPYELRDYIDYDSCGENIASDDDGVFTRYGYIYRENYNDYIEHYDGTNIPNEYKLVK